MTRLLQADAGQVLIDGHDLIHASRPELRALRKDIQMVFQDPMASLNPRKRVVDLIAQGPIVHGTPKAEAQPPAPANRLSWSS